MYYLYLENVGYASKSKEILKEINFSMINPCNIAIVGPSGCGKTTFLKLLSGNCFGNGRMFLNNLELRIENLAEWKKIISVVFDDDIYIKDTVYEELKNPLTNLILRPSEIDTRINDIVKYFKLETLLDSRINEMALEKKVLIKILAVLITNPQVIGFDDVVGYLNSDDKKLLFKYLRQKRHNFIMVTSDIEDVLNSDYLICMYKGSIAILGRTLEVLKEEKLLRRLGLGLPFYVDLSIQLGYYGLIEGDYFSKEDLVGAIWK